MRTLPVEFRHRVIALTEDGLTSGEIAEVLGVTAAWVRSIKRLYASGQTLEPKSRANRRRSLAEREGERIRARVAARPGSTLADLKRDLNLHTSIANLWYALRDLKISLKKSPSPPPSGAGPTRPPTAPPGTSSPRASTRAASSSSTRPSAPRP
jgi:transposase